MIGAPLSKINAKTTLLEGSRALIDDVRASHLGHETPSNKIRGEGVEVSHLLTDIGSHIGHLI